MITDLFLAVLQLSHPLSLDFKYVLVCPTAHPLLSVVRVKLLPSFQFTMVGYQQEGNGGDKIDDLSLSFLPTS